MNPPEVLIADSISPRGMEELSRDHALEVRWSPARAKPIFECPDFSGIIVRSETKVTAKVLEAAQILARGGSRGRRRG